MKQVFINNLDYKLSQIFNEMESNYNHYRFTPFLKLFEEKYPEDFQHIKSHYIEMCREFKKNRNATKPISVKDQLKRFYDRYVYKHYMMPKNEARAKHEKILFDKGKKLGFKVVKNRNKFYVYDLKTMKLIEGDLNIKQVYQCFKRRR